MNGMLVTCDLCTKDYYVLENVWKIMCRAVREKQWSRFRTICSSSRCRNVNRICQDFSKNVDSSLSLLDDSFDYDIHFNSTNFVVIAATTSKILPVNLKSPSLQSTQIRTTFTSTRSVNCTTGTTKLPQLEEMVWWMMMDFHFVSFIGRFFYFWWWPPTLIPDKPRGCPWSHRNPGWFDRYLSTSWENFMEGKRVKLQWFFDEFLPFFVFLTTIA